MVSQTLVTFKTEVQVLTDASKEGRGTHMNDKTAFGTWHPSWKSLPIYKLPRVGGNKTSPDDLQRRPEGQRCLSYM